MKTKPSEFEILPRGSDVQLKVRGASIQELFANTVKGLALYLDPAIATKKIVQTGEHHHVNVEAVDINSLLIEFLSDVISRSDIDNIIFTDVSFETFGENFLEGELVGIDSEDTGKTIQSVSYQDIDIKKNPENGLFEVLVVLEL